MVGSRAPSTYDEAGRAVMKEPGIGFVADRAGKPLGIDQQIGAKPIFIGGNSDGDFQMLDYATGGVGPSFGMIVTTPTGSALNRGLDEGPGRGWLIIDMARDWEQVRPGE